MFIALFSATINNNRKPLSANMACQEVWSVRISINSINCGLSSGAYDPEKNIGAINKTIFWGLYPDFGNVPMVDFKFNSMLITC
jgi:hypothetical protein